jgi:hypothetical protein
VVVAVIYLQGVGFKDAVFWLCNNFSSTPVQQNTSKQILKLPQRDDRKLLQIIHYLKDQHRIPKELINNLIESEKLYADVMANAVFLLLGKKKEIGKKDTFCRLCCEPTSQFIRAL